jgi:hypothetical protein
MALLREVTRSVRRYEVKNVWISQEQQSSVSLVHQSDTNPTFLTFHMKESVPIPACLPAIHTIKTID